MKKVVCIVGPTGVGKSDVSLEVAKHFGFEVINGDSVQVYKRLNIGSAKLTDFKGIKHHLIDFLDLGIDYSVCDFQRDVRSLIDKIDKPLIVGGTGLYVKAALYNYEFDDVKRDLDEDKSYDDIDTEKLYQMLLELDSNATVDRFNRRRVIRAYIEAKNNNILSSRKGKNEPLYDILIICLNADREIIYDRINKRVDKMIEMGLVEEVKSLRDDGFIQKEIGYREINNYFDGLYDLNTAIEEIKKNTRHYAKRQLTWFKNQMNAIMVDALDHPVDKCIKLIEDFYKK
ncbi:MAG: tRNA (adenosine(37)-N6)-dimethylallyltransferase MiaA [Acholeplasmatales bacterium]|nr:tRNA (adenosine(37)-N6)-dimethylallyltransferase MiaA [Acholeplasmatales bacterium]